MSALFLSTDVYTVVHKKQQSILCPNKKVPLIFFAIIFTNVNGFFCDLWYATLRVDTNHTGKFTL